MFAFTLCESLGYPHPDYLLPMLSSKQLAEWETYFLLKNDKIHIPMTEEQEVEYLESQFARMT